MKKNYLQILFTFSAALVFIACKKTKENPTPPPTVPPVVITPPPDFGFKVVGYFPYYRDPATVPDVKFKMTNVVNYAFGAVTSTGSVVINSPSTFSAVIAKAKNNNAKIFLSINGSHADWTNMAATAGKRNSFIRDVMNVVRGHQLHGVDMDWEFPRTSDGTDVTFTELMKELSDSCHRDGKYYLTAAITAGKYAGAIRDAIKTELFNYVDWFNIMAYDDFSTTTPYRHHSDLTLAQTCLSYWIGTRGMPKQKAVLGIPAYGRPSGITQTNTVLSYGQILSLGGSALSDSAIVTSSGYPSPYTIYYNGQPTTKKKAMLAKNTANGVMMWEKWHDTHDATSLLKAVCDTIGRAY
ncbi:MAG TPA: glycoside hydrolase family 18 protein [Chitinophagaceae bacterium]